MTNYIKACLLLLLCMCVTAGYAEKDKTKSIKKPKKETKYDRLFKDKKTETAKSKFITLHKVDGKLYFELPKKYLNQQMILGGTISSVTDPTYITVGARNFNPFAFYFAIQDSSVVMCTPNTIVYNNENASYQLKRVLQLNYRNPVLKGFKIAAYNNDSSAVVFDVTSLLCKPNSLLPVIPKKSGDFSIKATPKSEMSFIKSIKSFDDNVCIRNEFNYDITAMIMIAAVASNIPTTVGVTYNIALLPPSTMRPRIVDSRVGIDYTQKMVFSNEIAKSSMTYLAHRWNLVPTNKKAYTKGKLTNVEHNIVFYIDNTFPDKWIEPIKKGVALWNKAFEKIGFKNVLTTRMFPDDKTFDPDNLSYSCIRFIPNKGETITSSSIVSPETGEIRNATIFISSNIATLLHKKLFVATAAVDANARSEKMNDADFAAALTHVVACEVGKSLGLLNNLGASFTYPTNSLRNAQFVAKNGLAPSIMDDCLYNYVAQPQDKGVKTICNQLGVYDNHAIEWNYRYFDPEKVSMEQEVKTLEKMVDERVKNPHLRYYRSQTALYDPRVNAGALGNDAIKTATYGMKNLAIVNKNIARWIKNDDDSRIKEKMILAVSQQYYAYFKQVMANVGGIYLNDMKPQTGIPRYQVVPKAIQRASMLWALQQAKKFTSYANRALERKGAIAISYYDQLLEFIGYDIMGARKNVALASYIDPTSYTQKDYYDDLMTELFKSAVQCKAPSHEERILQNTFLTYMRATLQSSSKHGSHNGMGLQNTPKHASDAVALGYGNPTSSLYPLIDVRAVDKSEVYFFNCLLRLKPILEKAAKANLPVEAKSHYQMLLFKINKELEDK